MLRYVCEKHSRAMCTEISLFKQALAEHKYGYTNREVMHGIKAKETYPYK